MVSLQNVVMCVCALVVAVNGQSNPLGIYPNMTASATPGADTLLTMPNVVDLETQGVPNSCGATTAGANAVISLNMLTSYAVSSVMIVNKGSVQLTSPQSTVGITQLNGLNGAAGLAVSVSSSATASTPCTPSGTSTVNAPFVTSGSNIQANYSCGNTTGQYLVFTAPVGSTTGIYICQLTVMQQDQPLTTTTTTMAPTTTKKGARFVHFDWSIIIVMVLAVITKLMIDNGRQ